MKALESENTHNAAISSNDKLINEVQLNEFKFASKQANDKPSNISSREIIDPKTFEFKNKEDTESFKDLDNKKKAIVLLLAALLFIASITWKIILYLFNKGESIQVESINSNSISY
jgi:hypothetical protein